MLHPVYADAVAAAVEQLAVAAGKQEAGKTSGKPGAASAGAAEMAGAKTKLIRAINELAKALADDAKKQP